MAECLDAFGFQDSLPRSPGRDADKERDAYLLGEVGTYHLFNGNNAEGTACLEQSTALYADLGDSLHMASRLLNLHFCYQLSGRYAEAVACLETCLDYYEAHGNEVYRSRTLFSLGQIYGQAGKDSTACAYMEQALNALPEEDGLEVDRLYVLVALAELYLESGRLAEAETRALQAEALTGSMQATPNDLVTIYNSLAQVHQAEGRYDASLDYSERALQVIEGETAVPLSAILVATTFNIKGKTLRLTGRPHEAADCFLRALALSEPEENTYGMMLAYEGLSLVERTRGNLPKAIAYTDLYWEARTRLNSEESERQLNEFEVKYLTREKELQIQAHEATLKRNRVTQTALIVILSLSLVLVGLFLYLNLLRKRHNRALVQMNEMKTRFFSIISHDLRGPVYAQCEVLRQMTEHFDSLPLDFLRKQCRELSASSDKLLSLLQGLLDWARIETGRMKAVPVRLDLKMLVDDVAGTCHAQMAGKQVAVQNDIPAGTCAYADFDMAGIIVRNLLSNAVKFSPEQSLIAVAAAEEDGKWRVSVADRGAGMEADTLKRIWTNPVSSATGTAGETGSGLGLFICREMVEMNGGTIRIDRSDRSGTTVSFTLKKD